MQQMLDLASGDKLNVMINQSLNLTCTQEELAIYNDLVDSVMILQALQAIPH